MVGFVFHMRRENIGHPGSGANGDLVGVSVVEVDDRLRGWRVGAVGCRVGGVMGEHDGDPFGIRVGGPVGEILAGT